MIFTPDIASYLPKLLVQITPLAPAPDMPLRAYKTAAALLGKAWKPGSPP